MNEPTTHIMEKAQQSHNMSTMPLESLGMGEGPLRVHALSSMMSLCFKNGALGPLISCSHHHMHAYVLDRSPRIYNYVVTPHSRRITYSRTTLTLTRLTLITFWILLPSKML